MKVLFGTFLMLAAMVGGSQMALGVDEPYPKVESVPGELLVRYEKDVTGQEALEMNATLGANAVASYSIVDNLYLLQIPEGVPVAQVAEQYRQSARVLYAEPNYLYYALPGANVTPNDPGFSLLWGMDEIAAPSAWDLTTGSEDVVVFVIDSGGEYTHQDLQANRWENPGEIPGDGIDNDGNGYVDDVYGIDACNNDSDPMDDHSHGTHVSGTIGAVGNNGVGVAGVNWHVKIGWAKFLNSVGSGSVSDAIECLEYVLDLKNRGINVVATNNSWGGGAFSQALLDAIAANREAGVLFIAAAGNSSTDNDSSPQYPSSYRDPGIISVASTTSSNDLSSFSCYGHRSVDLGAPGSLVYSTVLGNGYDYKSGTSMAAPHVTGAIALLAAYDPTLDWRGLRNQVLSSGDNVPSLTDTTVSGKRLNAYGALTSAPQLVEGVKRPLSSELSARAGDKVLLEYLAIQGASPVAGPLLVAIGGDGTGQVTLRDDGVTPDLAAGDGLFSANWICPADEGSYTLQFPDGDTITASVTPSSGGQYEYSAVSMDWRVFTGTNLGLYDDDYQELTLPFPVSIGENVYDLLWVQSNGGITTDETYLWLTNIPLPDSRFGVLIVPWWDDMMPEPGTDRNVFWGVVGTAPNRELVIEWRNVKRYGVEDSARFQAVFPEADSPSSGRILFQYADVYFADAPEYDQGASVTVGVQTSDTTANQFSYNSASLDNGTALAWDPSVEDESSSVFRIAAQGDVSADGALHAAGFQSGFADLAEWVRISEPVSTGDVVELDPQNPGQYRKATGYCSSRVAGVVSTDPGLTLGGETQGARAVLALAGIVPVNVCDKGGAISLGDLLTVSSTPGVAQKADVRDLSGCGLVGKALEAMSEDVGSILVLLMR